MYSQCFVTKLSGIDKICICCLSWYELKFTAHSPSTKCRNKHRVVIWKPTALFLFPLLHPKEGANAALDKSASERQEINDFMKASEILMQRNAADLAKIRELFQKYGYKPHVEVPAGNMCYFLAMESWKTRNFSKMFLFVMCVFLLIKRSRSSVVFALCLTGAERFCCNCCSKNKTCKSLELHLLMCS